ncbi:MAG: hypothetical protein ACI8QC_001455 [Planctomycetota bacterium]|jgi:hypothetical protein
MAPGYSDQRPEDSAQLARAQGKLEAAELELERAHHLLDTWDVPRELPDPDGGRPVELSLAGRLELLSDEDD